MCLAVGCFPTPRLVRSQVRIGFDFFFLVFVLGCCLGLIFATRLIFFITFKNIDNIVEREKCNFIETNC